MSTITILHADGTHMCTTSPSVASRMEANFEVVPTTEPNVRRMLLPHEIHDRRVTAAKALARRVTGLAHPHDVATDAEVAEDLERGHWVGDEFVVEG
jgi:hypothetical protein